MLPDRSFTKDEPDGDCAAFYVTTLPAKKAAEPGVGGQVYSAMERIYGATGQPTMEDIMEEKPSTSSEVRRVEVEFHVKKDGSMVSLGSAAAEAVVIRGPMVSRDRAESDLKRLTAMMPQFANSAYIVCPDSTGCWVQVKIPSAGGEFAEKFYRVLAPLAEEAKRLLEKALVDLGGEELELRRKLAALEARKSDLENAMSVVKEQAEKAVAEEGNQETRAMGP